MSKLDAATRLSAISLLSLLALTSQPIYVWASGEDGQGESEALGLAEDALRLAKTVFEPAIAPVVEYTSLPIARDLANYLIQNGTLVRSLAEDFSSNLGGDDVSVLLEFFESELGTTWLEATPDLEAKYLEIASSSDFGSARPGDVAQLPTLDLARAISVLFFMKDDGADRSRRERDLAIALNDLFTQEEIVQLTLFFQGGAGQTWAGSQAIASSLVMASGRAGCLVAVVAPNYHDAVAKAMKKEGIQEPPGKAVMFERMKPFFIAIYGMCTCIWDKAAERWPIRELAQVGESEFGLFMGSLIESRECPAPWAASKND